MSLSRNGTVVGIFFSSGVYTSSARRLKMNIESLKPEMPGILSLKSQKYDYIASESSMKSIGFIAQDVKEYFSDLVLDDPSDDGGV